MTKSAAVIDYMAGLTVTQGAGIGRPLDLYPWERRFIQWSAGERRRGSGAVSVARGAGKTTLCAGLACAALDGPLATLQG